MLQQALRMHQRLRERVQAFPLDNIEELQRRAGGTIGPLFPCDRRLADIQDRRENPLAGPG